MALSCQKQGEGTSSIRVLAELPDDCEPGHLNVLVATDRLDDLIELSELSGQQVFRGLPFALIRRLRRSRWLCGDSTLGGWLMSAEGRFDSFLQVLKGLIDGFVLDLAAPGHPAFVNRPDEPAGLGIVANLNGAGFLDPAGDVRERRLE